MLDSKKDLFSFIVSWFEGVNYTYKCYTATRQEIDKIADKKGNHFREVKITTLGCFAPSAEPI